MWDEILCIFFTFSSQIHICTYNQIFIFLQTHEATPTKTHIKCTTHHNNVIFNSCSKNKRKLLMYFCSNSVKHYLNTHHHHHSHILSVCISVFVWLHKIMDIIRETKYKEYKKCRKYVKYNNIIYIKFTLYTLCWIYGISKIMRFSWNLYTNILYIHKRTYTSHGNDAIVGWTIQNLSGTVLNFGGLQCSDGLKWCLLILKYCIPSRSETLRDILVLFICMGFKT